MSNLLGLQELIDACQAMALAHKFEPDELSVYRSYCRKYSKSFHTPLHLVLKMDPEHVILNVYEDKLSEVDVEENAESLLDMIYSLADPEYEKQQKEEIDRFAEMAEEEERQRIAKGKPIHPALKEEAELFPKSLPKSGGINLSYLEDNDDNK